MKMKSKRGSSTKVIPDAESSHAPVTEDPMTPTAVVGEAPMKLKSKSDSSTKTVTDAESSRAPVTEDQIRQRAHEIFLARGGAPGQDLEDWLRAERELQASQKDRDRTPIRLKTAIGG